jgi:hypothetical protein
MIKTITEETTQQSAAHNKAFVEITKGLYEGKPLFVPSGVLTNLVNELNASRATS